MPGEIDELPKPGSWGHPRRTLSGGIPQTEAGRLTREDGPIASRGLSQVTGSPPLFMTAPLLICFSGRGTMNCCHLPEEEGEAQRALGLPEAPRPYRSGRLGLEPRSPAFKSRLKFLQGREVTPPGKVVSGSLGLLSEMENRQEFTERPLWKGQGVAWRRLPARAR